MNLAKTSLYNGLSVCIKMLTMLGLNKVLAVYVGPSGYAIIGQYQSFMQTLAGFSAGALANGITKYTAENSQNNIKRLEIWKTSGTICIISSLIISILTLLLFKNINTIIFHNKLENDISYWLAASFMLMMLNAYFLAILNGMKLVKAYVFINIAGSILTLIITVIATYYLALKGALIALTINQSACCIVTFIYFIKQRWFKLAYIFGSIDKQIVKGLGKFSIMAIASALCLPFAQIIIRNLIGAELSWLIAGYWEAMNRISTISITLATTTLTLYYLPKLTELHYQNEIKNELLKICKLVLPITFIGCVIVYCLRDLIIEILFSHNFIKMNVLFLGQLTGDFFKVLSWLFSFAILAKEKWKSFVICEVLASLVLVMINKIFITYFEWEYLSFAYAISYIIYFVTVFSVFYKLVYKEMNRDEHYS